MTGSDTPIFIACLIAVIVMTLSVLEDHSPIAGLFKCDIFALVLLFLDLFLLLHVRLGGRSTYIQSLRARDFDPMHRVLGRVFTCIQRLWSRLENIYRTSTKFQYLQD